MSGGAAGVVRRALQAYADKDRTAIEAVIGDGYRFTSPLDNGLDRETYFRRCWPNSENSAAFDVVAETVDGDRVFIVYELRTAEGKRFRNSEMHTVQSGRIVATEVYFGWDLPHPAPAGGFVDKPS